MTKLLVFIAMLVSPHSTAKRFGDADCLMDIGRVRELGRKYAPDLFVVPAPDSSTASFFAILIDATMNPVEVTKGTLPKPDKSGTLADTDIALAAFPQLGNERRIRCVSSRITRQRSNGSSPPNDIVITIVVLPK
jgi:hypothetical protein